MIQGENITSDNATDIAKSTLAYQMADKEQKEEIIKLFVAISEKIIEKESDKKKLPIYAKTLRGLNQTYILKARIEEKKEDLKKAKSHTDFLDLLWDLFISGNIQNSYFNYYEDKEKLKLATFKWVNGTPYYELFNILKEGKINGRDKIKLESCVNIFENGIAYSGSILINAITEILKTEGNNEYDSIIELLQLFQKQLKYGLPTIESILIYECGFCDRVIAQKIAGIMSPTADKHIMKTNILQKKEEILQILREYALYYVTVLERIME